MRLGWFGPKLFGVGVGVRTWQGWAVLAVGVIAVALAGWLLPFTSQELVFVRFGILILVGIIAWLTYSDTPSEL